MVSLRQRSYEKELLDGNDIPFADIARNMQELDTINRRLGGHAITIDGLEFLLQFHPAGESLHIMEIGCGGGDNLRAIADWSKKTGQPVLLTGVDSNAECIAYAQGRPANSGIYFICSDYRALKEQRHPDIIFSSLFCHHFSDDELVGQLRWMKEHARVGFFINDLHRHPLAYHSIKWLTSVFSKSYLVKNDAPLSVRRGFRRADWERLFDRAGITEFQCHWRWAFRWLITVCTA